MKKMIRAVAALSFVVVLVAGCAKRREPLGPGQARGALPDLRGRAVLVLPVQIRQGVPPEVTPDEELAHALRTRGPAVRWAFPADVERALARSPGLAARMHDLPVGIFLQAEVERVGDPLFGEIRRLAALTGAEVALLPVELRYDADGTYRITAAILSASSGRVAWVGVVQGEPGGADMPLTLASTAEALALAVLPWSELRGRPDGSRG